MVVGPCQHNYNEMHVRTHKIAIMVYAHLDFFLNCLPFQKNPLWMTTPKASKTSSLTRQVFWGLGVYNWLCWVQWSVVTQITLSRKLHKWCTNIRCVVKTCQGCTSHWLPILLQIKKKNYFTDLQDHCCLAMDTRVLKSSQNATKLIQCRGCCRLLPLYKAVIPHGTEFMVTVVLQGLLFIKQWFPEVLNAW